MPVMVKDYITALFVRTALVVNEEAGRTARTRQEIHVLDSALQCHVRVLGLFFTSHHIDISTQIRDFKCDVYGKAAYRQSHTLKVQGIP